MKRVLPMESNFRTSISAFKKGLRLENRKETLFKTILNVSSSHWLSHGESLFPAFIPEKRVSILFRPVDSIPFIISLNYCFPFSFRTPFCRCLANRGTHAYIQSDCNNSQCSWFYSQWEGDFVLLFLLPKIFELTPDCEPGCTHMWKVRSGAWETGRKWRGNRVKEKNRERKSVSQSDARLNMTINNKCV